MMEATMKPYEYNGIRGYSKQQAISIIGCKRLSTVTRLMSNGKLEVVGEMPIPHMPHVKRKLLSVESVKRCAENYTPRIHGAHMYQARMTYAQLRAVQKAFPAVEFFDLTESRRIRK